MMKVIRRTVRTIGSFAPLLALLVLIMGWQVLFMPHRAEAMECGNGEDECTAAESDGHDSACWEWKWFKHCYTVTYYHPPEPPPGG